MEESSILSDANDEDSVSKFLEQVNATIKPSKIHSDKWEEIYQKKRRELLAKESKSVKKGKRIAWRQDVKKRAAEYADHEMEQRMRLEATGDSPSDSNEDSQNPIPISKVKPTVRIHKRIPAKATPSPQPSAKPTPSPQPSAKATRTVQMPAKATPSRQPSTKPNPAPTPVKPTLGSDEKLALLPQPKAKPSPTPALKPGTKTSPAPKVKSTSAPTRITVAAKPKRSRQVRQSDQ